MGLHKFTEELPAYREKVRTSGHDARRQSFFDLARTAFGIDMLAWEEDAWEVETKVYRGWVDALLGRNPDGTYGSGPEGLLDLDGEKVAYADGVPFAAQISPDQLIQAIKDMPTSPAVGSN